jgi:hypothetical protein
MVQRLLERHHRADVQAVLVMGNVGKTQFFQTDRDMP